MVKKYVTKPQSDAGKLVVNDASLKKIAASFDRARKASMDKSNKNKGLDFVEVK